MSIHKKFSDINGTIVELGAITQMDNKLFVEKWPNVKGMKADGYTMWVARPATGGDYLPVTRMIEMKRNPSMHQCNAKCLNGKHNGACECQCGGKNHGAGMFSNLIQPA